ncbi:glutathione S-transferase [Loktanella ponticola]|uniref:Glutathione S-transferase n=1 Tax=Yoonia ponticola TaxID=1524255 RepID=A0A7W9BHZ0_9RHOB|nr:glutathione S-transferase family protein [Yoonia ponticola]MBB5720587.1 glutathione S-transferase [Yoonia ponticola]
MLTLHYAPKTISIAVAIALEEAGLAYDAVAVDFATGAQGSPEYLAVNPKGRVPSLITGAGTLTETGAILEFIADTSAQLMPDTPLAAARMREVMYYLASTMHVNHAHKMRGHRWADQQSSFDDMTAKVPETMAASCAYLESKLELDPFVSTDISIADPYLFVVLSWVPGDGVDLAKFPKLAAFVNLMRARPSVQAVTAKGML